MNLAYLAAPLCVLAYALTRIVDGLDGSRGPGAAWTIGHAAFLAALAFLVPILLGLRRKLGGKPLATAFTVIGFTGIAALTAQFVIDIVVGFMAADHDAMGPLFRQVKTVPGVTEAVYAVGPSLFYIGLSALVIQLAAARLTKAWVPVLVLVSSLLPLVDKDLLPIAALCQLAAFLALRDRTHAVSTHAVSTHAVSPKMPRIQAETKASSFHVS